MASLHHKLYKKIRVSPHTSLHSCFPSPTLLASLIHKAAPFPPKFFKRYRRYIHEVKLPETKQKAAVGS